MAAEKHVDAENGENRENKRKREPSVLDNFTKLTNGQEKVRVKAGINLLRHLTSGEEKVRLGLLFSNCNLSDFREKTSLNMHSDVLFEV